MSRILMITLSSFVHTLGLIMCCFENKTICAKVTEILAIFQIWLNDQVKHLVFRRS